MKSIQRSSYLLPFQYKQTSINQIVTSGELPDRDETVKILRTAPSVLSPGDVDDFCQLASYYSDRTPSSFKRDLAACFYSRAMITSSSKLNEVATQLKNSFCFNVSWNFVLVLRLSLLIILGFVQPQIFLCTCCYYLNYEAMFIKINLVKTY